MHAKTNVINKIYINNKEKMAIENLTKSKAIKKEKKNLQIWLHRIKKNIIKTLLLKNHSWPA